MGVYLGWQGGKVEVFFVTVTIAKNLSGYYLTYLKWWVDSHRILGLPFFFYNFDST